MMKKIEKIKLNFILPIHYYTQYQLNLVKLQIKSKGKSKIKRHTHKNTFRQEAREHDESRSTDKN